METHVSATEAARTFSDLLNRIRYRGESFVVERGGEPVCRMGPAAPPQCTVSDLVRVLRSAPRPDDDYLETVEDLTRNQPRVPRSPWPRS
jgi:antitoxin (DNA-binding transcriptional repressor) of toxin-antitoxin stability system